jgi:predicted nuclease with TOPRIM domain
MHRTIWRVFATLAALVVLALVRASVSAQTAAPAQNPEVLSALLVEVRGLRAAMEQLAGAGPRVQLAMGRLQLQEQRVNTLLRRLDEVRASLTTVERDADQMRQGVQQMEQSLQMPADDKMPPKHQIEQEINAFRSRLARHDAEMQRLQAEESTLTQQVALEQGRWSDINKSLDDLERALGRK